MQPIRQGASTRRAFTLLPACLAALAASVLISACGGISDGQGNMPNKQEARAGAVKFAKCMREHGIEVEVGANGGGVSIGIHSHVGGAGGEHAGTGGPPPEIEAAQKACDHFLPNDGQPQKLSPAEEAKQREAALKFARCMRSHGVDVPDPNAEGGLELGSDVDPQSKIFEAAQKACQGVMGKLPLRVSARASSPGGGETTRVGK